LLGVLLIVTASRRGMASNKENADRFAANVLPVIQKASGVASLRAIAKALNARGNSDGSRRRLDASASHGCVARAAAQSQRGPGCQGISR
jgi:hypothetical protein